MSYTYGLCLSEKDLFLNHEYGDVIAEFMYCS